MAHLPIDHPLRGLYRGLAFLIGAVLLLFGIAGFIQTSGLPFFDQEGERVLWLTTNPAFSLLNIVVGAGVIVVTLIGRNLDVWSNVALGTIFMFSGLIMLCLLRTDLNFLAFSMTNVIVSFVIGMVLMTAGLYGGVSRQPAQRSRAKTETKADAKAGAAS
jgi:uncharacterized protein YacL